MCSRLSVGSSVSPGFWRLQTHKTQAPAFGTPGGLGIRAEKPCITCGIGQMDIHSLAPVLRISVRFAVRRGIRRDILAHASERRFVIYENLGEPRVLPTLREDVA